MGKPARTTATKGKTNTGRGGGHWENV